MCNGDADQEIMSNEVTMSEEMPAAKDRLPGIAIWRLDDALTALDTVVATLDSAMRAQSLDDGKATLEVAKAKVAEARTATHQVLAVAQEEPATNHDDELS